MGSSFSVQSCGYTRIQAARSLGAQLEYRGYILKHIDEKDFFIETKYRRIMVKFENIETQQGQIIKARIDF